MAVDEQDTSVEQTTLTDDLDAHEDSAHEIPFTVGVDVVRMFGGRDVVVEVECAVGQFTAKFGGYLGEVTVASGRLILGIEDGGHLEIGDDDPAAFIERDAVTFLTRNAVITVALKERLVARYVGTDDDA